MKQYQPIIKKVLIVFFYCLPLGVFSNDGSTSDLRLRTSVEANKKLFKNFEIFGEAEMALEQNISTVGKLFAEVGAEYSPYKHLSVEARYRFSKNRKSTSDNFKYTHMFALGAQYDHKIERCRLYYRLQYQNIDEDATESESLSENSNVFKTRVKLKYSPRKSKFDPFISTELYISPGEDTFLETKKLKSYIGFDYKLNKTIDLRLYYRNDYELGSSLPYIYHTFGVTCSFDL